jgi:hypothetical protein
MWDEGRSGLQLFGLVLHGRMHCDFIYNRMSHRLLVSTRVCFHRAATHHSVASDSNQPAFDPRQVIMSALMGGRRKSIVSGVTPIVWWRMQSLRLMCALLLILVLPPTTLLGQSPISVDDIVAGINERRSTIEDLTLRYTVTTQRTDMFYLESRQRREHAVDGGVPPESLPTVASEEDYPRHMIGHYGLTEKGPMLRYELRSADDPDHVNELASFDGEVFRGLLPDELRATVGLRSGALVVPFVRVFELLRANNEDLAALLADSSANATVTDFQTYDDCAIAIIEAERSLPRPAGLPEDAVFPDMRFLYQFEIDVTRNFWPTFIQVATVQTDHTSGESVRILMNETRCDEIVPVSEESDLYYPRQIVATRFAHLFENLPGSVLPKLNENSASVITTLEIQDVAANQGLDDEHFTLAFPPGTSYIDERDGGAYIVDADGKVNALVADAGERSLPVSQFTQEEAAEIIGPGGRISRTSSVDGGGARSWLLAINIVVLAALCGYFVVRRVLAGRNSKS